MSKVYLEKSCFYCKTPFLPNSGIQQYCSPKCYNLSPSKPPVKETRITNYGYEFVWINRKRIVVHRLVMEQHLGRPLLKSEVVHHIDGNKRNNAIDNLQLATSHSEHRRLHHPRHINEVEAECMKCHVVKPRSDFFKRGYTPQGIFSECIDCTNAYRAARKAAKGKE